ncbi:MAG: hypothetical protein ACP5SG_04760 [Dissulfurimicrobium sp.]|uniref:hypothetical protein n=1 Tax=Dissulfurimicrobium TaxID=1769732 RepID=UPI001EDC5E2C|nr:hypothetical protein [Dissulfurimicrobium hydrothermale]UKL14391.1 hypothetical protein LGS26_03915 [Dissulfurimicrobium hydrothermale]
MMAVDIKAAAKYLESSVGKRTSFFEVMFYPEAVKVSSSLSSCSSTLALLLGSAMLGAS